MSVLFTVGHPLTRLRCLPGCSSTASRRWRMCARTLQPTLSAVFPGSVGGLHLPESRSPTYSSAAGSQERKPGLLPPGQGAVRAPGQGAAICRVGWNVCARVEAVPHRLMCAEKDPFDCHRAVLVARRVYESGTSLSNIHAGWPFRRSMQKWKPACSIC